MSGLVANNRRKGRKRKYRVKNSAVAGLQRREIHWRDWSPQLILLLPLLQQDNALEAIVTLSSSVRKYTGKSFLGAVTSWMNICESNAAALAMIREENPPFFNGSNRAVFAIFDFPAPTITDLSNTHIPTASDVTALVFTLKALESPRGAVSTAAKAAYVWLSAEADERSRELCEAHLAGDQTNGSSVRAVWNAHVGAGREKPDAQWAASFISWGMKRTPCILSNHQPIVSQRGLTAQDDM
ncbi:MAG: hypothetical protein JO325_24635 [Solirubrobacterales bacterium]|nr:hypothetical protein [Solirubrobacterales bacterium]